MFWLLRWTEGYNLKNLKCVKLELCNELFDPIVFTQIKLTTNGSVRHFLDFSQIFQKGFIRVYGDPIFCLFNCFVKILIRFTCNFSAKIGFFYEFDWLIWLRLLVLSQAESIIGMLTFGKTWCFKKIMNFFNQNIQGNLSAKVNKLGIIVAKANLFQETKFCPIIFT